MLLEETEKYYVELPKFCPLEGAHCVNENLTVYRFVAHDIPSENDFRPVGLNPQKSYFKKKPETYCKSLALSVLTDLKEAETALSGMSERFAASRFVAEGVITPTCGRIKSTPGPIGESHISWWPYLGVVPSLSFKVTGGVSRGF